MIEWEAGPTVEVHMAYFDDVRSSGPSPRIAYIAMIVIAVLAIVAGLASPHPQDNRAQIAADAAKHQIAAADARAGFDPEQR